MNWARGTVYHASFAVEMLDAERFDAERTNFRLFITGNYDEDFNPLDRMFFHGQQAFFEGDDKEPDFGQFGEFYKDLMARLHETFPDSVASHEDIFAELRNRKEREAGGYEDMHLSTLFRDLRLEYQHLRIGRLLASDETLQGQIENARQPVD
jgi:hypothetical protein